MPDLTMSSVEAWDRSMAVNARGIFVTCRAFARSMAGTTAAVSSMSLRSMAWSHPIRRIMRTVKSAPRLIIPTTRVGMIMLSKYFATYYARSGVRVNCIAPGGLFNNQPEPFYSRYVAKVPLGRMAAPDDLKGVTVFLASSASSYITGTVIPVDGGLTVQ